MRIIELIPTIASGGGEKFVVDLSNELSIQGHDVSLITLFDYNDSFIFESLVNKNVKRISLHKKEGLDISCFFKVLNVIREIKPDVVHAHVGAIKYITLSAILYKKCRYFATIHSEAKREAGNSIDLYSRKFLFTNKMVTAVTISDESLRSFEEFYGISAPMIMNGCSAYSEYSKVSDYHKDVDLLFVHAGRIQKVKNQYRLVKSFQRLIEEGYNVRLLLLGRIEHEDVFESIRPYFSDKIVYLGEKNNCRDYMNVADAFCLSSNMEGMPITVIEAMSVGCIPIVTPVGGCVNMIYNRENGFIAKDCTDEAYYDSLKEFASIGSEERTLISDKTKETFVKTYSISSSAINYVKLFNEKK